jgi:hypothetical protein
MKESVSSSFPSSRKPLRERRRNQHQARKPLISNRGLVGNNGLLLALADELDLSLKQILSRESAAGQRRTLLELLRATAGSSNQTR